MSELDPRDRRDDAEAIEALLRRTGSRPSVPADRAARVAAATKAHWRAEVRRASRQRWTWRALAAAASIAIVAVGFGLLDASRSPSGGLVDAFFGAFRSARSSSPAAASSATGGSTTASSQAGAAGAAAASAARVELVSESAWLRLPGHESQPPAPLRSGDRIVVGAEVATEQRGRAALRLATGHSIRLDTATRLRLVADRAIALDRGAVYIDSRSRDGAPAGSLEVRTPFGTFRDIGTQFEVRWLPASVRVRVREGRVAFETSSTVITVDAGHEAERAIAAPGLEPTVAATVAAIGPRQIPIAAVSFDWVRSVTPMLEIDGRSLQTFLEWIARERGLRLHFATPREAAAAPGIRLTGSIAGMTLDQALDSVLATCQMSHRIEGDVLRIASASEPRRARGTP